MSVLFFRINLRQHIFGITVEVCGEKSGSTFLIRKGRSASTMGEISDAGRYAGCARSIEDDVLRDDVFIVDVRIVGKK
jgi:hypothetical protein